MLTGDTVLGRGTTVVAHPDGQLGAYLDSLDRLHALAEARRGRHHLARPRPGASTTRSASSTTTSPTAASGSTRSEARARAAARRRARGVADATSLPRRVVEIVYADVDPVLWGAAELSVRAQLELPARRDVRTLRRPSMLSGRGG